ncbi:MAG TPA: membrane protein insertase YidC [Solirubrobacteraceae bacterium]|nr:membrane protein insertase YidC [Solirubrobacteraceae bacterium]
MQTILANVIQDAFGPLISVFETILVFIHAHITGGSWGLAIIGLTIVVRAALVPLTLKQFSSMAKLQALGPELKELQKRYKDDKQRLNEEMMKFYKANEVNPFGSCLPLILQLPVFLSLFYMLRVDLKKHICGAALQAHHIVSQNAIAKVSCGSIDAHSGKFLFIPDITSAASGAVLAVLIVLYVGSQLVSSLLTTATVDRNQRMLMLGLPFVFSIFIARFPAGLIVYWITTNLWTVGQQYIVRKRSAPLLAVAAPVSGGGGRGASAAALEPAAEKAPAQGLMARMAATRDAARSAVTGQGGAGGSAKVTKSGGGRPSRTPASATPDGSGGKAAAPKSPRGGTPKGASGAAASPTKAGATRGKGAGATTGATQARPSGGAAKPAAKAGSDAGAGKDEASIPHRRGAAPPPPPRKKKKRSGRRR